MNKLNLFNIYFLTINIENITISFYVEKQNNLHFSHKTIITILYTRIKIKFFSTFNIFYLKIVFNLYIEYTNLYKGRKSIQKINYKNNRNETNAGNNFLIFDFISSGHPIRILEKYCCRAQHYSDPYN